MPRHAYDVRFLVICTYVCGIKSVTGSLGEEKERRGGGLLSIYHSIHVQVEVFLFLEATCYLPDSFCVFKGGPNCFKAGHKPAPKLQENNRNSA